MQRTPASGRQGAAAPLGSTVAEVLEQTRAVVEEKRPWYEAIVVCGQKAEASAGDQITAGVVRGLRLAVDAVNVDLLKPLCVGLEALFAAIEGATAAREELISLLSYCVSITNIILNQARLADLPKHITDALQQVEAEMDGIIQTARLFDEKTGSCLPCRRLRRHASDREEIQQHEARLKEILDLATQATTFDTNAITRAALNTVTSLARGPPALDMAGIPTSAPLQPLNYVERTSLLEDVVATITTTADGMSAPHVLFGVGGSGKTTLASALISHDRIRKHFRRGVFWIDAGQNSTLVDLLQTLARNMIDHHAGPIEFSSEDEGIHRLNAWATEDSLTRLVVLDDVVEADVVNALRHTGLKLLVTTRVRDIVAAEAGNTEVGSLTKAEASFLLKKQSGAVYLPEVEADKVAEDCGWLALALTIAGALPSIRASPDDLEAWRDLHVEIAKKKRAQDDLRMPPGINQDESTLALFPVLGLGMNQLGEDTRNLFFNLVVLARGVSAPVDMLTNLWGQKDDLGAIEKANLLTGRSLLQRTKGGHYKLHDLVFDFVRMKCDFKYRTVLQMGAMERQRRYLGRLVTLQHYSGVVEHLHTGVHALVNLWRSLEELSGTDRLTETYTASLDKLGRAETADTAHAHNAVARFFHLMGKYAEADPLYVRAIEIGDKTLGPEHPELAAWLNNRAELLQAQGKYAEADPLYVRAFKIGDKTRGPEHPELAAWLNNRAELLQAQGKCAEADRLHLRAIEIVEKTSGSEHLAVATWLIKRAGLLQAQGKYPEADLLHLRAIEIVEKTLGSEHPAVATWLNNRARLLQAQGKLIEADRLYLRAIEIAQNR